MACLFVIVDNIMSLFVDLPKPADDILLDSRNVGSAKNSVVCVACCCDQLVFIVSTLRYDFFCVVV